jgi:signal transduction histidine kinase
MARLNLGLEQRAVLAVVAIHLLVLPIVGGLLLVVAQETLASSFVQRVRTLARGVADAIEIPSVLEDTNQTSNLLDSVILTGEGVYAELLDNGRRTVSVLNRPTVSYTGIQDFDVFEHSATTYFLVLPINTPGHTAEVRLGFDKHATLDNIARIRWNSVKVLVSYAVLSLGLTIAFVRHLTRPLARLRFAARQVASGAYERHLSADTGIPEVQDLAADLETMRCELVGVTAKLRAEMTERQAVEAQRKALEIELRRRQRLETIGRLAGGVAHEINNSLVPILVFAQVVFDALPTESPSREHVTGILRSARRSKEVIKKMLTFSRQLDLGKLELLNLSEPVDEVARLFRTLAPPGIAVVKRIEAGCPPVMADATLINLLMMNLCTNALQAMHATGGTLTVTLGQCTVPHPGSAEDLPGAYLDLGVGDTGHGMDAATAERIFEPFFTTREQGEGTGLGLAVVHGIAESLGAIVLVDSSPGAGTQFRVLFPIPAGHLSGSDSRPLRLT